jgi:cytochrome c
MNLVKIELALGCMFAASIALSTVHPWGNPRSGIQPDAPLLQGSDVPDRVRSTLEVKCGDCHSEKTRYPFYSHLAPASWMIERDVHEGRSNLDLSLWQSYRDETRIYVLSRIASEVHSGQMPPGMYVVLHPRNRLSPQEEQLIYDWARSERKRIRQSLVGGSDRSSIEVKAAQP